MRTITIVAGLMLMLSACGGSSSGTASTPAPVESVTASAGVAEQVPDCPEGPPARGALRANTDDNDGVVGMIYNPGSPNRRYGNSDLVVALNKKGAGFSYTTTVCFLKPGKAVAYAFGEGVRFALATRHWYESWGDKKFRYGHTWFNFSLEDPTMGYPSVTWGIPGDGWCPAGTKTNKLSEGERAEDFGYVRRLPDEAAAARKFSGTDSSNVDDWARIEISFNGDFECYEPRDPTPSEE